jgi:ribokinase
MDVIYRVEEIAPFLEAAPGLKLGGEAALDGAAERRLQDLLARYGRLIAKSGGGQAANTAFALARMGIPAALVGRVGRDADGAFLKESLNGVNLDYLTEAGESGRAYVLVDTSGERTILVVPNTNDEFQERDLPREALRKAAWVHFTSFVGEGPLKVETLAARRLAETISGEGQGDPGQGSGAMMSLDPGELYARRGQEALAELLARLETLILTEEEWLLMGGHLDCHPDWAPPFVLIKRGALGARLLMGGYFQDFPGESPDKLVDTLGAGDVFAAGYLAGRVLGRKLVTAVRLAIRAATRSLTGTGRERYPDEAFLQEQLNRLR